VKNFESWRPPPLKVCRCVSRVRVGRAKDIIENVDDNPLAEQHFIRAHTPETRESETGLIVVRANSNQLLGKQEISRELSPGNSSHEGLQTKLKDHCSLLTPACSPSSCLSGRAGVAWWKEGGYTVAGGGGGGGALLNFAVHITKTTFSNDASAIIFTNQKA
jgi:hypothetical protein